MQSRLYRASAHLCDEQKVEYIGCAPIPCDRFTRGSRPERASGMMRSTVRRSIPRSGQPVRNAGERAPRLSRGTGLAARKNPDGRTPPRADLFPQNYSDEPGSHLSSLTLPIPKSLRSFCFRPHDFMHLTLKPTKSWLVEEQWRQSRRVPQYWWSMMSAASPIRWRSF